METTPALTKLVSGAGHVRASATGWQLSIPVGPPGAYRLAQLDNYSRLNRGDFPSHPPFGLCLTARISPSATTGTWGFGLWNDPFTFALNPFAKRVLPSLPQTAWFFWASSASYLSFRDDLPANGLIAQVFRSAGWWTWLPSAGITLLFKRAAARAILRRHIEEYSKRVTVDPRAWHEYEIRWREKSVWFLVDGRAISRSAVAPRSPLGLVIWIDNQYAAFEPTGRLAWGFERTDSESSLEIRDLRISDLV